MCEFCSSWKVCTFHCFMIGLISKAVQKCSTTAVKYIVLDSTFNSIDIIHIMYTNYKSNSVCSVWSKYIHFYNFWLLDSQVLSWTSQYKTWHNFQKQHGLFEEIHILLDNSLWWSNRYYRVQGDGLCYFSHLGGEKQIMDDWLLLSFISFLHACIVHSSILHCA